MFGRLAGRLADRRFTETRYLAHFQRSSRKARHVLVGCKDRPKGEPCDMHHSICFLWQKSVYIMIQGETC